MTDTQVELGVTDEELQDFMESSTKLATDFFLGLDTFLSPRLNPGGPREAIAMLAALETACLNLRLCILDAGLPSLTPEETHHMVRLLATELRRRRGVS